MELMKSYEFFKPEQCKEKIHIIGCGSIGSTVAENLARLGLTNFTLYDFDTVSSHNIVNQMFDTRHVGMNKTVAVKQMLCDINPEIGKTIKTFEEGYKSQRLSGYVFLCVDKIDLRREIAKSQKANRSIKAMFDFRTRLTDAQHYAANWSSIMEIDNLIESMNFTEEEALEDTPVSACNVTLSVASTIRTICAYGVSNFMNYVKGGILKKYIWVDAFAFMVDAF